MRLAVALLFVFALFVPTSLRAQVGKTRPSWDPIGVLFGVRSQADIWKIQTDGHNHIFANGTNQWRDGPKTNHHLVLLQPGTAQRLRETLDQLMVQAPRPKR